MKDIHVSVRDLCVRFGDEDVLRHISRDFEAGRIHGITGNNGSGKTVLFKCICGFMRPTSGLVLVDYEQVGKDKDFPDNTGVIIETPGFLPGLTGYRNLKLLAGLKRIAGDTEIRKAMERTGLDPDLRKPVRAYSLGMRQRLGIAQAIMEKPSLLILDEPFNGLDKNGAEAMRELFAALRSKEGTTILITSHNPEDIRSLCDSVCEMDSGRLEVVRECPD